MAHTTPAGRQLAAFAPMNADEDGDQLDLIEAAAEAGELAEALAAATGGIVHRLTVNGPACGIGADASAAWLALDSDPAAVTCTDCAGWHDPECTSCAHDCPWRRHHIGAPYCQTCDDHAEAAELAEA